MPLEESMREIIRDYCIRDLPGNLQWHVNQFSFIDDNVELKTRLGRAFYSARYIAKLMEALYANSDEIHSFVKFQTIQYASIYEAVISYLLWNKYKDNEEVRKLQTHKAYKPVSALGSLTKITYDGEDVYPCVYRDTKTPKSSIPFHDKVDCGVRIGFIDEQYAGDIKSLYELRNLAHIENEAEKQIEIELQHARHGYWRMKPFLEKVNECLGT